MIKGRTYRCCLCDTMRVLVLGLFPVYEVPVQLVPLGGALPALFSAG